jgi:hypothetical protein
LRAELGELDLRQPVTVPTGPVIASTVVSHVISQEQLSQPVPGAHQIAAQILACSDQIAQRLLLTARHANRVQRSDHQ